MRIFIYSIFKYTDFTHIYIYMQIYVKSPVHQTIRLPWGHNSYHLCCSCRYLLAQGPNIQERGEKRAAIGKALWCQHRISFGWKRGLLKGEIFRWNIQEQSWGNSYHFHFLVDKETLSGCSGPVYWAHPSYTWVAEPVGSRCHFLREKPVI